MGNTNETPENFYTNKDMIYYLKNNNNIKCKFYNFCECELDITTKRRSNNHVCNSCYELWKINEQFNKGTLDTCDMCTSTNIICFSQSKCKHKLCRECFRYCYYGIIHITPEPAFPFPDKEDEYYNDEITRYNLDKTQIIKKWKKACDKTYYIHEKRNTIKCNCKKCPLCST